MSAEIPLHKSFEKDLDLIANSEDLSEDKLHGIVSKWGESMWTGLIFAKIHKTGAPEGWPEATRIRAEKLAVKMLNSEKYETHPYVKAGVELSDEVLGKLVELADKYTW